MNKISYPLKKYLPINSKSLDSKLVYIIENNVVLKNIIVSEDDPYRKLYSFVKEEILYSDNSDF